MAVVAVVLLVLATSMLAHGLLVLATLQRDASRAGERVLRARLAAEASVLVLAADTGSTARAGTPLWGVADSAFSLLVDTVAADDSVVVVGVGSVSARLVRLSRETWLVEGRARVGPTTRRGAARAVWVLDPAAIVAAQPVALLVGAADSARVEGVVEVAGFTAVPTVAPPVDCVAVSSSVDSLLEGRRPTPLGADVAASVAALGRFDVPALAAGRPARVAGSGTPVPASAGTECLTELAWNWGDPGGGTRPCGGYLAMVVGAPGLRVDGGTGQGILVLEGDATLVDLDFYGIVLSAGRVKLEGATTIHGLIRAATGADVGPLARVDGSACWGAAALSHASLRVPILLAESGWIQAR